MFTFPTTSKPKTLYLNIYYLVSNSKFAEDPNHMFGASILSVLLLELLVRVQFF